MPSTSPVVIVGAPRSGTSLMQKLIRETPGFASVPRESDMIWLPYCHPSRNDWEYEGCPESRITTDIIDDIKQAFSDQALSASTWRTIDRLGLMEKPRLSQCLRLVYRSLFSPWANFRERTRKSSAAPGRLVDKSVHAALWLNLVDAVFPDAQYIHMVRTPDACIPSMMQGWTMQSRFRTYRIPDAVANPREDTSGWWCFPLPAGWQAYYDKTLLEICAFQWRCINEQILNFLSSRSFAGKVLRVHLEDLTGDPDRILSEVSDFIGVDAHSLKPVNRALPKVNASHFNEPIDEQTRHAIHELTHRTYDILTS